MNTNRHGFTLVELLVVIGIIAVLSIVTNKHQPMFSCPEATKMEDSPVGTGNTAIGYARAETGWWAARPNWMGPAVGTYGFNCWLYSMPGTTDTRYWQRPAGIRTSNNVPVFVDCAWAEIWPTPTDAPPASMSDPYFAYRSGGAAPSSMGKAAMNRHPGPAVNVAFMDGSARTVHLPDLWLQTWYAGYVPPSVRPTMPPH